MEYYAELFVYKACGSIAEPVYYKIRQYIGCPANCHGKLANSKVGYKCPTCKAYYPL